jgi:hypothetical protein
MIKHLNKKKKCIKRPTVYIIDDTKLYNDSLIKIDNNQEKSNDEKINDFNNDDTMINNEKINDTKINDTKTKDSSIYCKFNNKYNGSIYKKQLQLDKLFWCFYQLYELNEFNEQKKIEFQFKIEFVEKLRQNKNILKANRLKILQLEDEFANQPKITISGFHSLCLLYNLGVIIKRDNKTYYKFNIDDISLTEKINIVNFTNNTFTIENDINSTKIHDILDNYYYIEDYNKVLKGISSYKVDELRVLANKLNIETTKDNKNKTKPELYQEIYNKIL